MAGRPLGIENSISRFPDCIVTHGKRCRKVQDQRWGYQRYRLAQLAPPGEQLARADAIPARHATHRAFVVKTLIRASTPWSALASSHDIIIASALPANRASRTRGSHRRQQDGVATALTYAGLVPSDMKRLCQLEGNAVLKRLVTDLSLDEAMPQHVV